MKGAVLILALTACTSVPSVPVTLPDATHTGGAGAVAVEAVASARIRPVRVVTPALEWTRRNCGEVWAVAPAGVVGYTQGGLVRSVAGQHHTVAGMLRMCQPCSRATYDAVHAAGRSVVELEWSGGAVSEAIVPFVRCEP